MANAAARRRLATLLAAAGAAVFSMTAWGDGSGDWRSGAEVYEKVCGYCHEPQYNIGPMIRGLPPEYVRFVVRHGLRAMPPFRHTEIDDQALAMLVEYLQREAP